MPVGSIAEGILGSLAGHIKGERQRTRDAEDAQIDQHMQLIQHLANRPDANPALLGQALHDLTELGAAKAGQRKLKGGSEGFMGASELPLSQFLLGVQQGTRPIQGPTTEAVPAPQTASQQGLLPEGGMELPPMHNAANERLEGAASTYIPPAPIGEPTPSMMQPAGTAGMPGMAMSFAQPGVDTAGLAKAGKATAAYEAGPKTKPLPMDKQPYLRSPEEMALQEGNAAGIKAGAVQGAKQKADYTELASLGFSPEEIRQMERSKVGGAVSVDTAPELFLLPGSKDPIYGYRKADKAGNMVIVGQDNKPLPAGAKAYVKATGEGASTDIKNYEYDKAQGYKGSFQQWQNEDANRKKPNPTVIRNEFGFNGPQRFNAVNTLQTQWRKAAAPLSTMLNQYNLMQEGLKRAAAGDMNAGSQAVLVTFQKILDPNSVVRESEYARSPEGVGLMQRIQGAIQRLSQGGAGVPLAELQGFERVAKQFIVGLQGSLEPQRAQLISQAATVGIKPEEIFGTDTGLPQMNNQKPKKSLADFGLAAPATIPAPPVQ